MEFPSDSKRPAWLVTMPGRGVVTKIQRWAALGRPNLFPEPTMKTGLATLSVLAVVALGASAGRLASQTPLDVNTTIRVAAGEARGDGGNYHSRRLQSFSIALDVARHRAGGSGPLLGVGYNYYHQRAPESFSPVVVDVICISYLSCGGYKPSERFPEVRFGYVDAGWRWATSDFRTDVLLQPGVVLTSRADVAPFGTGGAASLTRRIGSFGVELGLSSTYIPGFYGARIGLSQVALGLRSW
jgi:hypothetical protein